tara:strand:+ start:117 stop:515 length:399 start_codon:yes stop_codon:yes gene_type:complete
MAYGYSAVLPLQRSVEDGFYALTKTLAANIKQNLKNILLTGPGERVMLPNFGVGLRRILFTNASEGLEAEITERIESQVETYMPFVSIDQINYFKFNTTVEVSEKEHQYDIQIYYSVPELNFNDLLEVIKLP